MVKVLSWKIEEIYNFFLFCSTKLQKWNDYTYFLSYALGFLVVVACQVSILNSIRYSLLISLLGIIKAKIMVLSLKSTAQIILYYILKCSLIFKGNLKHVVFNYPPSHLDTNERFKLIQIDTQNSNYAMFGARFDR